tara:strand:- start:139 stop:684 length:546 start_codon:yes stop_codon:yes gene_type:complete
MSKLQELKDKEKLAQMLVNKFDGTVSDADGDFTLRNTDRIDIAQLKAEEYLTNKDITYKNIGFDSKEDRIPTRMFFAIPSFLRCMPDILVYHNEAISFLEVKGCTEKAKFKIDDLKEYSLWNGIAPVRFFVYSKVLDKKWIMNLDNIWGILDMGNLDRYKDNNKIYVEIPCDILTEMRYER